MIYLVRVELPQNKQQAMEKAVPTKLRLEEAGGAPCLVRWFADVSSAEVESLPVRAIIIAGFGPDIQEIGEPAFRPLAEVIRKTSLPVIGICGGHQLLGCIFGGDPWVNYPMRPLRPGEPDIAEYHPGMFKEWGFYRVRRLSDDGGGALSAVGRISAPHAPLAVVTLRGRTLELRRAASTHRRSVPCWDLLPSSSFSGQCLIQPAQTHRGRSHVYFLSLRVSPSAGKF